VELLTSGELRVVDEQGRMCRATVPRSVKSRARNVIMAGYTMTRGNRHGDGGRLVFTPPTRRWCTPDGYVKSAPLKDVIISGGENISSVEVEGVLLRHPRYWKWRWSVCRTRNGAKRPHAFVVLRPASRPEKGNPRILPRQPSRLQTPKAYSFCDRIAETATGKIQKYVLRGKQTAIAGSDDSKARMQALWPGGSKCNRTQMEQWVPKWAPDYLWVGGGADRGMNSAS